MIEFLALYTLVGLGMMARVYYVASTCPPKVTAELHEALRQHRNENPVHSERIENALRVIENPVWTSIACGVFWPRVVYLTLKGKTDA